MKKQVISFILLFVLIVPAVVTYSWLQHHKRAVKKEVKWKMIAGIDKKELAFLKFSKKEIDTKLHWEHSKEFEFNNQMYDVVERKSTNDSVSLWCWLDAKETKLNKQLNNLLATAFQKDTQSNSKQQQLFKFYKFLYFQDAFSWKPFEEDVNAVIIWNKNSFYIPISRLISLPPPKFS